MGNFEKALWKGTSRLGESVRKLRSVNPIRRNTWCLSKDTSGLKCKLKIVRGNTVRKLDWEHNRECQIEDLGEYRVCEKRGDHSQKHSRFLHEGANLEGGWEMDGDRESMCIK